VIRIIIFAVLIYFCLSIIIITQWVTNKTTDRTCCLLASCAFVGYTIRWLCDLLTMQFSVHGTTLPPSLKMVQPFIHLFSCTPCRALWNLVTLTWPLELEVASQAVLVRTTWVQNLNFQCNFILYLQTWMSHRWMWHASLEILIFLLFWNVYHLMALQLLRNFEACVTFHLEVMAHFLSPYYAVLRPDVLTSKSLYYQLHNSGLFRIAAMTSWIKIKHIYNNKWNYCRTTMETMYI